MPEPRLYLIRHAQALSAAHELLALNPALVLGPDLVIVGRVDFPTPRGPG